MRSSNVPSPKMGRYALAPSILSTPTPLVALACGSRSNSNTRRPAAAMQAARFTAVVVFPTPPFWLATAITLVGTRRIKGKPGGQFKKPNDQITKHSRASARLLGPWVLGFPDLQYLAPSLFCLQHQHGNMKLIIIPHNVTLTKAIEDHIVGKIEKLDHFDKRAIDARVILEHDHTRVPEKQFSCSVRLS